MTRLVALLSWWDENPDWLADVVRSLALADVDALVAVDGSYPHMPGATASSEPEQAVEIQVAARVLPLGAYVYQPSELWASECVKRTAMFRYAEDFDPDWLLVIDADEVILQAPDDLKARLAASPVDYADVCSLEQPAQVLGGGVEDADIPQVLASRWVKPRRCLFRAVPGITVGPAHYNYVTPDGRDLWGDEYGSPLRIRDMMIDHRGARRDPERLRARQAYYEARDIAGVEGHRVTSWGTAGPEKVTETEALLKKALERA
jgi:hypothetical protein